MRPHPLLRRLAARSGAAFRCAARLAAREDLAQAFAPGLDASPLVAEERLEKLAAPADGSAAIRRVLGRVVGGGAEVERGNSRLAQSALAGLAASGPAGGEGSARRSRPSPRPPRAVGAAPAAGADAGLPFPSPEQVQAILDRSACGGDEAPAGQEDSARSAGAPRPAAPRADSEQDRPAAARRVAGRQRPLPPSPAASLLAPGSSSLLLDRAARTTLAAGEPEAALAAILDAVRSGSGSGSAAPVGPSTASRAGSGPEAGGLAEAASVAAARRAPSAPPAPASPASSPRNSSAGRLSHPASGRTLSGASPLGGLRGLAALAAAAEDDPAPSSTSSPRSADRPHAGPSEAAFGEGLRSASDRSASPLAEPFASAAPTSGFPFPAAPLSPDLEALLDQALRRAARRHGIEVPAS